MLLIVRVTLPVLLRVKPSAELLVVAGWLVKVKVVGERLAVGPVPVPVKLTDCGLLVALSVKDKVAVRLREVVGAKVMLAVQVPFEASGLRLRQLSLEMA